MPKLKTVEEVQTDFADKITNIDYDVYNNGLEFHVAKAAAEQAFRDVLTQNRLSISTALVEALEGKKMKTPDNALAQFAEREKMGFNTGITDAQNLIKQLLESKN